MQTGCQIQLRYICWGEVRHRHHKPKIQVQGQEIDLTTKREINTKVSKVFVRYIDRDKCLLS